MTLPRRRRSILRMGALVALCLPGLAETFAGEEEAGGGVPPGELSAKVEVILAAEGEMPVRIHAFGTVIVRPDRQATVAARVGGLVTSVEATDGDDVKAGAPLVRLDERPFKEALAKAEAAVTAARSELDKAVAFTFDSEQAELDRGAAEARALVPPARREADRLTGLLASGLSSDKAVADARVAAEVAERAAVAAEAKTGAYREKGRSAELARLEAGVALAAADVPSARRALEGTVIVAPTSGRLSRFIVARGQSIDAGQSLGEVVAPDAIGLRCAVVPSDADAIVAGAPTAVPDRGWKGTVASVGGAADAETGLVSVVVGLGPFEKAPRLGDAVLAEIDRGPKVHGILLPASALEVRDDVLRVMVVGKDDIAHLVTVTLLARGAEQVLVSGEGLVAGARVVVEGNYNLPDGAHVVVAPTEKPTDATSPGSPAMSGSGTR